MNTDAIAARRQHIQDSAPCVGCGATLASCKASRGKDPAAPEWFGCCARGLSMEPCYHKVDPGALMALVREIESGNLRTVEQVAAESLLAAASGPSWFEYLNQGEVWRPNGKPPLPITDMDPEWRFNAARWLVRGAAVIGRRYGLAASLRLAVELSSPLGPSDASADSIQAGIEREDEEIARDPVAWIRTTPLYRALVAGLPTEGKDAEALAERARHWGACPGRTGSGDCRCEQIRAEHAAREAVLDTTPEWTL